MKREPTFRAAARTWSEDEDRELVERLRGGDREALSVLVVRYQRPLYNAALWVLHRAEDASDVCQTVFLRVAERLDDYDPRYRFFSWIYRIAVNEAIDQLRRRGREEPLDEAFELAGEARDDPAQRFAATQRAQRLRGALKRLPPGDRVVLTLRHFSECSYEEIAQILEIDDKTVKSRLFEARQRLRRLLKDL